MAKGMRGGVVMGEHGLAGSTGIQPAGRQPGEPGSTGGEPAQGTTSGTGSVRGNGGGLGRRIIVITVIVAVMVAAVVVGVWVFRQRHASALEGCDHAYQSYTAGATKQRHAREEARRTLQATPEQKVADSATRKTLERTIREPAGHTTAACTANQDTGQLDRNRDGLDKAATTNRALVDRYRVAIAKVRASARVKSLADGKKGLDDVINSASSLLGDSDGKVADNAARDALAKTIDTARQVSGRKGVTDPKIYTDARKGLEDAVKAVNDSIGRKQAADAAAATQAVTPTAPATGSSRTGYTSGGYAGGTRSGGGSAPIQVPHPQVPQGGSSSNSGGLVDMGGSWTPGSDPVMTNS